MKLFGELGFVTNSKRLDFGDGPAGDVDRRIFKEQFLSLRDSGKLL